MQAVRRLYTPKKAVHESFRNYRKHIDRSVKELAKAMGIMNDGELEEFFMDDSEQAQGERRTMEKTTQGISVIAGEHHLRFLCAVEEDKQNKQEV